MKLPRPDDPDRGAHVRVPNPPYLYRLRAGAGDVGLSARTIWEAVKAGELEAHRFGSSKVILLRPVDVRAWAELRLRPYRRNGAGARP